MGKIPNRITPPVLGSPLIESAMSPRRKRHSLISDFTGTIPRTRKLSTIGRTPLKKRVKAAAQSSNKFDGLLPLATLMELIAAARHFEESQHVTQI
jgi:hypothetical protein